MPSTSNNDQLFGGNDSNNNKTPIIIESPTMLLSVLHSQLKDFLQQHFNNDNDNDNNNKINNAEEKWQTFVKSSWAKHWLPELKYLEEWTLSDIALLLFIFVLSCSWYTIRSDRKSREQQQQQKVKQQKVKQQHEHEHEREESSIDDDDNEKVATKEDDPKQTDQTHGWQYAYKAYTASSLSSYLETALQLPTLNIAPPNIRALGFSTGSSWERRLQTLTMFSCSLAFVMPGILICWANVIHFGVLLPLHVFVLKDYDYDNDGNIGNTSNSSINGSSSSIDDDEYIPAWYQLKTVLLTLCIWIYMVHAFGFDLSPTTGSRTPWLRTGFGFGFGFDKFGFGWWNYACDYLPVVLVKTADLPATTTTRVGNSVVTMPAKYVLGYHPHGIIAVGAFCAFATDGARVLDLSKVSKLSKMNRNNKKDDDDDDDDGDDDNSSSGGFTPRRQPLRAATLSLSEETTTTINKNNNKRYRGFSSLFPNLDRRIVTLPVNFKTPFLRDYFLAMGAITSSKEAFRRYLNLDLCISSSGQTKTKTKTTNDPQQEGRAMVVVVGGAAESMLAHEGQIELVLKHRRGFVREAIMGNANLVPVLGFGE